MTSTMTLLKWVIKRQAPNTAICWYEIEDLHAAGTKKKKKNGASICKTLCPQHMLAPKRGPQLGRNFIKFAQKLTGS